MSKIKTQKAFSDAFSALYFPRVNRTHVPHNTYSETMIELNTKHFGKENLCKNCKGTAQCRECDFTGLKDPDLLRSLPWDA